MTAIPMLDEEECYLAAILDDPSGIELAEFTWVDEENDDACFRCWDFQWALYRNEATYQIDYMGRSLGKALDVDTPLPTPAGWKTMGDLSVGDLVYGADGRPTVVKAAYEVRLGRPCYEVVFATGDVIVADADHEWTVTDSGRPRVLTTQQISQRKTTVFVQTAQPVQGLRGLPLPVEPYLLGYWLGDGNTRNGAITVGTADLDEFLQRVEGLGYVATVAGPYETHPGAVRVSLKSPQGTALGQLLTMIGAKAPDLKVIERFKRIPELYMMASEAERWELLRGFMDADGYAGTDGRCSFDLMNPRLGEQVFTLVASLGERITFRTGRAKLNGRDVGERQRYGWMATRGNPFSYKRKVDRVKMIASRRRGIISVRPVESRPVRCITVEAEDSLFLVGRGHIPTHNSVGIQMRAFAFPFNFPGAEMLITAPELNHLRPVTDKVEHLFLSTRLGQAMLKNTRGRGINHQPQFQAHFQNNARILSRLPNRDGRGVKGQHPLVIEMDEGQDYPEAGWTEIIETMKSATPGAQWRVHGVSRGLRDRYYKYTVGENPDLPFYVHRYMAMHRPSWSAGERRMKISMYGGTDENIDYRRNIYGEHGDATATLFVLHRLMQNVRIAETKWAVEYNEEIYSRIVISDELLKSSGAPIELFLQFPETHLDDKYFSFWAGQDIGFTRDPSEVLIFGELEHPDRARRLKGENLMRLLARIHMMRISAADQAAVIRQVFEFYGERMRRFSMDKTGNGLPLWQELDPGAVGTAVERRRTPDHISKRIRGYGFSNKVAVEFDDRELVGKETAIDAVIEKNVISFAADELRKLVDTYCIELPYDADLLTEWQGQEIEYSRDENSAAGRKTKLVGGSLHTLDAGFMMIAGKQLMGIEKALKVVEKQHAPVLARFG